MQCVSHNHHFWALKLCVLSFNMDNDSMARASIKKLFLYSTICSDDLPLAKQKKTSEMVEMYKLPFVLIYCLLRATSDNEEDEELANTLK